MMAELQRLQAHAWEALGRVLRSPASPSAATAAARAILAAVNGAAEGDTDPAEAKLTIERLEARLAENDAEVDAAVAARRNEKK